MPRKKIALTFSTEDLEWELRERGMAPTAQQLRNILDDIDEEYYLAAYRIKLMSLVFNKWMEDYPDKLDKIKIYDKNKSCGRCMGKSEVIYDKGGRFWHCVECGHLWDGKTPEPDKDAEDGSPEYKRWYMLNAKRQGAAPAKKLMEAVNEIEKQ